MEKGDGANIKAGLEHLTPAEQTKATLQLVLQAAAKTDEVLKAKLKKEEEARKKKEEGVDGSPGWFRLYVSSLQAPPESCRQAARAAAGPVITCPSPGRSRRGRAGSRQPAFLSGAFIDPDREVMSSERLPSLAAAILSGGSISVKSHVLRFLFLNKAECRPPLRFNVLKCSGVISPGQRSGGAALHHRDPQRCSSPRQRPFHTVLSPAFGGEGV
ncbi:hypothetical protein SKAU_G00229160 [Synaphobranchus kaupii]|uniref:Uncharacterized protein n=1 Tax=Synaphobranchus kaupii TaxID=118154 RepID=A0A9Q1F5E6_SYNKA|nr:hypothetical protein SKAU_G00229160 [Synaphobranchus kaupii]